MNAYFHQLSESTSNRFTVEASDLGLRPDLWPREFYRHALSIAGWRVEMGPIATAVTAAVNADYATETLAFYQNAAAHNRLRRVCLGTPRSTDGVPRHTLRNYATP